MIVAVNGDLFGPFENNLQHFPHVFFDGLGVGPTQRHFQLVATMFLGFGHPAFAAQLAVGKVEEEVSFLVDGDMVVKREILAVLERLEAVDDDFLDPRGVLHYLIVKQHTVTGEPGQMPINGARADSQIPGNLAVSHTTDSLHQDRCVEIGSLLPVGCGECLGAEAAFAGLAGKPLDTSWGLESPEGANFLEGPRIVDCVVVYAVRVGAVGRNP